MSLLLSFPISGIRYLFQGLVALGMLVSASYAKDAGSEGTTVLTVIVTRHGVRSYENPTTPQFYSWADWGQSPNNLTRHGYRLMTIMGEFYKRAQSTTKLPVESSCNNVFVYSDVEQRTLGTAHALIEGMCGSPGAAEIFHEVLGDECKEKLACCPKDPMFDSADWLDHSRRIDLAESRDAVAAAAGMPLDLIVGKFEQDFKSFQDLLNKRCTRVRCIPLASEKSSISDKPPLAALKGPVDEARTFSENIFLEYAQCGNIFHPVGKEHAAISSANISQEDLSGLQAGMRLHVLGYEVNAREKLVYNPFIRGETLLWHIAAVFDQKAGRPRVSHESAIPGELKDKSIVIFSGHDTQLAALGGILDAHWDPSSGNIERDDMPPGSALVFDLMQEADNAFSVRVRFASMTRERFRTEHPLNIKDWLNDGIRFYPVSIGLCRSSGAKCNCNAGGCSAPLDQFEAVALSGAEKGGKSIVAYEWSASSVLLPWDPGSSGKLSDPPWTNCDGR